jgi:aminotransferase EvaB
MTGASLIPFFAAGREFEAHRDAFLLTLEKCITSPTLILGENVRTLEERFAQSCGSAHGVGVASGTDALLLALKGLGIGEGDEVITVANTAVATVAAIRMAGATPVFVDVDRDTLLMDTTKLAGVITKKTKAIIPVHLFGNAVPMDTILAIGKPKKLLIIEDCAQAYGTLYQGKPVGSFGDIGCFSFYPTKNLGAWGDGGMCVTNDGALADKIRSLRMYGFGKERISEDEGVNSRLDELQAAILLEKLKRFPEDLQKRRAIAKKYDEALALRLRSGQGGSPRKTLETTKGAEHSYHLYVIWAEDRAKVQQTFKDAGIVTLMHYAFPIHTMPAYAFLGYKKGDLPITEEACDHILSIPLFPYLTEEEVGRIGDALGSI